MWRGLGRSLVRRVCCRSTDRPTAPKKFMHHFLVGWFAGMIPCGIVLLVHFVKSGFKAGINFHLDD